MVNRCYTMYMQQCNNVLFNLLDSHDTERLMNRLKNLNVFYQQLAVLFYHAWKSLHLLRNGNCNGRRTRSGLQALYAVG